MKRLFLLLSILLVSLTMSALDIPAGTYYFDNSRTHYSCVKFVYGQYDQPETYVVSLTEGENDLWTLVMEQPAMGMYRYTFAETSLPDGRIDDTFPNVKEYISKSLNELRTATTDKTMTPGYTFVPESGDNWAQGSWQPMVSRPQPSGTLPVMYIQTEGQKAITSKETYINATYYIDAFGLSGYNSIGSKEAPLPLRIRGRGNYTWSDFDKKPYRIKLEESKELLGMTKSKNFALLAHADDRVGFMRNTIGLELSRCLKMKWTPEQQPVELVLNGDYIGLYFLTETIRIDKDRVNIVPQNDDETDPNRITGGWLVEIDNYNDPCQIQVQETSSRTLKLTYHTPESLSAIQQIYLKEQWEEVVRRVYATDKRDAEWEEMVDMDQLARFYVVQEVMDNQESFHGSCFIYKNQGENEKWTFGPVWDFGNALQRGTDKFIYEDPQFGTHLIDEIARFPRFQEYVKQVWTAFYRFSYPTLDDYADDYSTRIAYAAACDAARWPNYGNADEQERSRQFMDKLHRKVDWLYGQWGLVELPVTIGRDVVQPVVRVVDGRLEVESCVPIAAVYVYDAAGRLAMLPVTVASHTSADHVCVDFSNPSGIYIVEVKTANQIAPFRKKIIIR